MGNYWKADEIGTHGYASDPHYDIAINGKVNINPQSGQSENKIELKVNGMYRMVNDWLDSNHQLGEKEREELINKLSMNGKKIYNTITGKWQDK